MSACDDELAWLSDYVVSVLKSPTWVSPIAQFIDERCDLFDDTEENELLHTACHNEFKQLVNDLLVSHLQEVSVQPDEFERFCDRGLAGHTRLHRALVEQLLSVDDFLAFKAMMAKHNAELIREAITCETLEDDGDVGGDLQGSMHFMAAQVVASSIEEGLRSSDAEWQLYEDNKCKASRGPHSDEESLEVQLRCEEAELEQVIALSLQVEEERLRQYTENILPQPEQLPAAPPEVQQPAPELQPVPPLPASVGTLSSPFCLVPPKIKLPTAPRMVEVETISRGPRQRGGVWGFTSAPLCPLPPQLPPEQPNLAVGSTLVQEPQSVPAAAVAAAPKVVGFTSSPLCFRPPAPKPSPAPESPALPSDTPVPAVQEEESHLQKLPSTELECMRINLRLWRERAARAIMTRAQSSLGATLGRTPASTLQSLREAAAAQGPSDEERRQRAEHLSRQRDRLKLKRQRDREQQLAEFQRCNAPPGSAIAASLDRAAGQVGNVAEGRRLVAALSSGAVVASPSAPPLPDAAAAADRLRQAMTLQLRQTLLRTTASDVGTLDGQLSQLELLKKSG